MELFNAASRRQLEFALFVVRVISGLTIAAHGWQKVFSYGIATMTSNFIGMGAPMPAITAPFISVLELVGGVLLVVGVLTRPIAMLLAIDMFAAAALVHLKQGFFAPKGAELVLLLMTMFVAQAVGGGGAFSIDSMLAKPDDSRR